MRKHDVNRITVFPIKVTQHNFWSKVKVNKTLRGPSGENGLLL